MPSEHAALHETHRDLVTALGEYVGAIEADPSNAPTIAIAGHGVREAALAFGEAVFAVCDHGNVFAHLTCERPTADESSLTNLASADEFTDAHGTLWRRRRGEPLRGKSLERLLLKPDVQVLHDYMGEANPVPTEDRDGFWAAANERMDQSAYSDFYGADFKNAQGEHLLVIHEDC